MSFNTPMKLEKNERNHGAFTQDLRFFYFDLFITSNRKALNFILLKLSSLTDTPPAIPNRSQYTAAPRRYAPCDHPYSL